MTNQERPTVTITGNVNAANANFAEQTFKGDTSFSFTMAASSEAPQQQLQAQLQQLADALTKVPAEQKEDAEVVAALAQEAADEASREEPRGKLLEIKGENLVKAAKNLLTVAPIAVEIAKTLLMLR